MSGISETDPPEDGVETLAAEFVLGLLPSDRLPQVVQWRREGDRFDQAVQEWELRLLPLADQLEPVAPPRRLWAAIERRLGRIARRDGLWRRLAFWRGFGLAAAGAVAALGAILLLRPLPAPVAAGGGSAPLATAILASAQNGAFLATAQPVAGGIRLVVSPLRVNLPAGRSAELWMIAPGAKPAALGLLAASRPVIRIMPVGAAAIRSARLAISVEPPGGSPTGQPTGPVIAATGFVLF